MQILAVDIGTGTQDILLYNSDFTPENCYKIIAPSPTMILRRKIIQATRRQMPILITGVIMGGGPCHWAVEDHLRHKLAVYATPEAAQTFNDDLDKVKQMGITIVSEDEASQLSNTTLPFHFCDLDISAIENAFQSLSVSLAKIESIAVAVFDHGAAPPGISDRSFRFDYLNKCLQRSPTLSTFAYKAEDIPPEMTRLQAVAKSASHWNIPVMVMDTGPAAIQGAMLDPLSHISHQSTIIANIGNFHTLAFRMHANSVEGLFEHHTGFLNPEKLETYLNQLASGAITNQQIFDDQGHGALVYKNTPISADGSYRLVATGPRRNMLTNSPLRPYFAVPFGDMMASGCYGLIQAASDIFPSWKEQINLSFHPTRVNRSAPWEFD